MDNLTWIHGSHALKAGFDVRHSRLSQIVTNNDRGSFTFTGQFTNRPGAAGTGNSAADLLLGYPQGAAAAAGDSIGHFFNEMQGYYFQDDWKISRG